LGLVGQHVHHRDARGEHQHHGLDHGIVAAGDRLVGQRAEPGQAEQHLHRQRAADHAGQDQPGERDGAGHGVGQQMPQHDAGGGQALGARGADMGGGGGLLQVLMQRLGDLPGIVEAQDQHRQQHLADHRQPAEPDRKQQDAGQPHAEGGQRDGPQVQRLHRRRQERARPQHRRGRQRDAQRKPGQQCQRGQGEGGGQGGEDQLCHRPLEPQRQAEIAGQGAAGPQAELGCDIGVQAHLGAQGGDRLVVQAAFQGHGIHHVPGHHADQQEHGHRDGGQQQPLLQHGPRGLCEVAHHRRVARSGSSARRSRSPASAKPSVARLSASTGASTACGAASAKRVAPEIMRPQLGVSGATPRPKKLSTLSVVMARGMMMAAWVTRLPAMFGRMCRTSVASGAAPITRAAAT
jgi:hypothetical protein